MFHFLIEPRQDQTRDDIPERFPQERLQEAFRGVGWGAGFSTTNFLLLHMTHDLVCFVHCYMITPVSSLFVCLGS